MTAARRVARGRALGASVLVLTLAVCGTACSGVPATSAPASTPTRSVVPPPPTAAVDVPVVSSTLPAAEVALAPVRLVATSVGVDMPVVPVGVDPTSAMELPADPSVAGWYRYGPDAASQAGHIVISAHIDAPQYPIGPLSRLSELPVGAEFVVTDDEGTARAFRVESVTFYDKAVLPVDEIFRRDGAPALVVITCGGPFDSASGHYRDNVVAIASPL